MNTQYHPDSIFNIYPFPKIRKILNNIPLYLPEDDEREKLNIALKKSNRYVDFDNNDARTLFIFLFELLEDVTSQRDISETQEKFEEKWKSKNTELDDMCFLVDICAYPKTFRGKYMLQRYKRIRKSLKKEGKNDNEVMNIYHFEDGVRDIWVSDNLDPNIIIGQLEQYKNTRGYKKIDKDIVEAIHKFEEWKVENHEKHQENEAKRLDFLKETVISDGSLSETIENLLSKEVEQNNKKDGINQKDTKKRKPQKFETIELKSKDWSKLRITFSRLYDVGADRCIMYEGDKKIWEGDHYQLGFYKSDVKKEETRPWIFLKALALSNKHTRKEKRVNFEKTSIPQYESRISLEDIKIQMNQILKGKNISNQNIHQYKIELMRAFKNIFNMKTDPFGDSGSKKNTKGVESIYIPLFDIDLDITLDEGFKNKDDSEYRNSLLQHNKNEYEESMRDDRSGDHRGDVHDENDPESMMEEWGY